MKAHYNSLIRSVCSLAVGVLLFCYPEDAGSWLVQLIGALFLVPGVISIVSYVVRFGDKDKPTPAESEGTVVHVPVFPVVGIGSVLLGLWLIITPGFFCTMLTYVFGAIFVLAGINQLANLTRARRWQKVHWAFYIVPVAILLIGTFLIICQTQAKTATSLVPYTVLGNFFIIYAIAEVVNTLCFHGFVHHEPVVQTEPTPAPVEEAEITDVAEE